ncbi:hypothetical protein Pyn_16612 [Prunus yedoensis var. nudiflora]|uniref:Uncharacterized protein n=1 Tax=Prunus yedoensis var. nudiflora TaxID=2094558 RepID=A0A314UCR2_PRUYE|nr:hypothetical protein Pyn_16612 [Prunus yedoensis var. nudiflora]
MTTWPSSHPTRKHAGQKPPELEGAELPTSFLGTKDSNQGNITRGQRFCQKHLIIPSMNRSRSTYQ